jgi:hypothetical protein
MGYVLDTLLRLLTLTRKSPDFPPQIIYILAVKIEPRVIFRSGDKNRFLIQELLSVILQNNPETRAVFRSQGGIESLLRAARVFRKKGVLSQDQPYELNFGKGVFNLLDLIVQEPEGAREFNMLEGCKVMVSFFISFGAEHLQPFVRPALSILSKTLTIESCQSIIISGGLLYLFPIMLEVVFKDIRVTDTHQYCLRILRALILNTTGIFQYRIFNKLK